MKSEKGPTSDWKGGEPEGPPAFSSYIADTKKEGTSWGRDTIYSHDAHVNSSGEALYRFLLDQKSQNLPVLRLFLKGEGIEDQSDTYKDRTNFNFWVDVPLPDDLIKEGVYYSFDDLEPAYRGGTTKQIQSGSFTEDSNSKALAEYAKQRDQRRKRGIPPWSYNSNEQDLLVLDCGSQVEIAERLHALHANPWKSSKNLKEWADEYCAKSTSRKEFAFQQEVYGWNFAKLEELLRSLIKRLGYGGIIEVRYWTVNSRVFVRPPGTISKVISKIWSPGSSVWKVAGVAYPLTKWVPVDGSEPAPTESSKVIKTSAGFMKQIGLTEEEWFRKWEPMLTSAITKKFACPL
ncbi:hypothetical protein FA15DRAFT_690169 [Coprinopsis marcescibilis]|uniref:Uncharacterized protein n=1 Tax=Coprinopsis marcescibilis TaxID=230819 RepID=A0A5C3LC37_COPMA|nr:hypothetical protein FA15DRAFT_690169 [Coprinopsis marcescibilis]